MSKHGLLYPLSQFDRTKKPSVRVTDEPKPSLNGSAKDSPQNGPVVPDRSVKPSFPSNSSLSKEEQSQIHSEAVAVMEKAKLEQEKRNQERRLEEERREREQKEKELKERQEREESEEEEKGHQDKKKLERQKAEEEEDKGNRVWEEKERRGKEQSSDTPSKSMSLDSPAPNHIVSEMKVSPLVGVCHRHSGCFQWKVQRENVESRLNICAFGIKNTRIQWNEQGSVPIFRVPLSLLSEICG